MSFRRPPNLTEEEEKQLKEEMVPLWSSGATGPEIAETLGFGEPGRYAKLKPEYVYNYRRKFGLPKRYDRAHYPHRYKHGKQQRPITATEFIQKLEELPSFTFHDRRRRAFNIIAFYTGLRQSEIRMLRRRDFRVDGDRIIVSAFRKKKGRISKEEATRPLILKAYWRLIPELMDWVCGFGSDGLVFGFSATTAWKYAKALYPRGYPHYFRLNKITDMCNSTNMTVAEVRNWTALHIATIEKYISRSRRLVETAADKMDYPREQP